MPYLVHTGTDIITHYAVVSDEHDVVDTQQHHFHVERLTDAAFDSIKQRVRQIRKEFESAPTMPVSVSLDNIENLSSELLSAQPLVPEAEKLP